jgi:hypothetical protein
MSFAQKFGNQGRRFTSSYGEYVEKIVIPNNTIGRPWRNGRSQKQHSTEVKPSLKTAGGLLFTIPRGAFRYLFELLAERVSQVFPFGLDCLLCIRNESENNLQTNFLFAGISLQGYLLIHSGFRKVPWLQ